MAVLFSVESIQSSQNKDYTSLLSEQQVVSYQISLRALESSEGNARAFSELTANKRRFVEILDLNFNHFVYKQRKLRTCS